MVMGMHRPGEPYLRPSACLLDTGPLSGCTLCSHPPESDPARTTGRTTMPDLTSPAKYGPRQQRDAIKDAEMLRLWATDLEAEVRLNDTRLIEQRLTAMAATVERLRALTARASA